MGIQNFPTALQPIIQQNFLEREFQQALTSRLGYRACADREDIAVGIGETLTKTRAGLKPSVTTPVPPATNTNLDNGLTPGNWGVEQYTLTINHYAATTDLNMVTSRVGIASQFLHNAFVNGVQTPVGSGTTLTVTVGSNPYTLVGVAVDATNVSKVVGGMSGVLTFSSSVSVADGTVGNAVIAANASAIVRPSQRASTSQLVAGDTLTISCLLDAVAKLRANAVPEIGGAYNCYLDPISARQLFADNDFRQLFQGATSANEVFRQGMVNDFLGLRFVTTTKAYVQTHPTVSSLLVRRPIVCGQGALIEGDFAGMAADDVAPKDSIVTVVDGIAMVTREPIDRLQQIIAQSWYWIGGFCAPTDTTTNPTTVSTSSNAAYKRAVMLEHIG